MKVLVYDLEIVKAVPGRDERIDGIEYCNGWEDKAGMGVSVIGAFDYNQQRYRVFLEDNFTEFLLLARDASLLVTFNGIGFDNQVVEACIGNLGKGTRNYDLMKEMMVVAEVDNRKGFSLGATCQANFSEGKSMDGGLAPVNWQEGRRGTVIDYCLNDVRLTKLLFDKVRANGGLRDPRDPSRFLEMAKPKLK